MPSNSRTGEAENGDVQRAAAIRHAEEDAARERTRALRYEQEDRHRTRWRRWIKTTAIVTSTLAGLVITAVAFYQGLQEFREEREDRRNARMVRAWELLRESMGEPGNVGQINALETLYIGDENLQNLAFGCVKEIRKAGSCMYLVGVDLRPIETDETPRKANLRKADLSGADLRGAKLTGANLSSGKLRLGDFRGAILDGADLNEADLYEAVLSGVDLKGADLRGAILVRSVLKDADLSGAKLSGADLSAANFKDAKGAPDLSESCADPDNPPTNLPKDAVLPPGFTGPDDWKPCPPREQGN